MPRGRHGGAISPILVNLDFNSYDKKHESQMYLRYADDLIMGMGRGHRHVDFASGLN